MKAEASLPLGWRVGSVGEGYCPSAPHDSQTIASPSASCVGINRVGEGLKAEKAYTFIVACRIRASRLGHVERRQGEGKEMSQGSAYYFNVACVKPYVENESMAIYETIL